MNSAFVNRGRLEIIYEILSICRKPTNKTRILYRCNLSYNQLKKYLEYLALYGLLSSFKEKRKEFYCITDKAKEFITEYEKLNSFLGEEEKTSAVLHNSYSNSVLHNPKRHWSSIA
jgi:predicted transcriptional regulator